MPNILDAIQVSGASYDLKDKNAPSVSSLTQSEYDNLPSTAKTSNTFFVITDAQGGDLSNYWTTAQTQSAITQATSGLQETLVSGTNIKTINNTSLLGSGNIDIQGGGGSSYTAGTGIDITNNVISVTGMVDTTTYNTYTAATDTALSNKQTTLTAGTGISIVDNVISATGGGGGGKTVTGGTNISVTTGETADTINCTLPISADSKGIYTTSTYPFLSTSKKSGNVVFGYNNTLDTFGTNKNSNYNLFFGSNNHITVNGSGMFIGGLNNSNSGNYSNMTACVALGASNIVGNPFEFASGQFNVTHFNSTSFGDSGNTLFSVGNGTSSSARHNAFEIRQNGDIYLTSGGTDIKLQDHLGGGGASYSAGTGIDITNNVISVSGVVETSAITTAITSSSTDAQVPSAKAVYDQLGGLKLVKLTQSEYDSLSPNYDSNTLYVIVN